MLSSVREAIAPYITEDNDLLFLHTTLYEGGACAPNLFNTGPVPSQQIAPLIDHAVGQGATTYSIVAHDYLYGREMASLAKDLIADGGGTVLSENYYPFETTDFSDAVRIVNDDAADVVVNLLIVPGTIGFYNQLGASGNDAMILHPGLDEVGGGAIDSAFLQNTVVALDWVRSLTATDPVSEQVAAEFDAITGGDPPFSGAMMTTGGLRAMRLWAAAVEAAGTLDAEAVRDAMVGLTIDDGPGGSFSMDNQHHTVMNVYLATFSDDGTLSIIETREAVAPDQECGF
jgi:branched-chain amino acid transport system substrate-binding protein